MLRNSRFLRKGTAILLQVPRALRRLGTDKIAYSRHPPLLANSFPKSGTHLLLQILRAIPGARYYGSFLASTPTLGFRERSQARHVSLIRRIVPGETLPAHLFYHSAYHAALTEHSVMHFFIYRDLRDVVVSEAHYIAHMNPWHAMHRYFLRLATPDARILAAIRGVPQATCGYEYPNVAQRFERYRPWLSQEGVVSVRYEEIQSPRQADVVRRIVAMSIGGNTGVEQDVLTAKAVSAIKPSQSHTFRRGISGGWRDSFTPDHRRAMKDVAGHLLIELGYEATMDW